MELATIISYIYAVTNIGASWSLNQRVKLGPFLGIAGSILGFTTGLLSSDAKGLMLNTPFYFIFGILALRSGRWANQPWLRHEKGNK